MRALLTAVLTVFTLCAVPATAHLMSAQKGTINFAGDGGYVVISVPVSALQGVDDDKDGLLSGVEMRAHYAAIEAQVLAGIQLIDGNIKGNNVRPLQGLMFSLAPPDNAPNGPASQIIMLGRFLLAAPVSSTDTTQRLRLRVALFGSKPVERSFQVTASRGPESQLLVFNSDRRERALFASAWSVLADYFALGAEHIMLGFDHLLFLLVVLAAGWRWQQVLLALTCFTLGHAVTLAISVWGGVQVSPAIVEPAIAATIVGIAAYDIRRRTRPSAITQSSWHRLLLVFACALIHGLGLGTTLIELGLDSHHRVVSLAGFNVGIELGQIAVALLAGGLMVAVHRMTGASGVRVATQGATYLGMLLGTAWFLQRIVEGS